MKGANVGSYYSGGSRRVSVVSQYRNPFLKPEETLQDKFALKLYKPTNLYTAIEVNSYLETLEIFSTYVRQRGCTFLILDISFPLREFIRIASVVIFMKQKALDVGGFLAKKMPRPSE